MRQIEGVADQAIPAATLTIGTDSGSASAARASQVVLGSAVHAAACRRPAGGPSAATFGSSRVGPHDNGEQRVVA